MGDWRQRAQGEYRSLYGILWGVVFWVLSCGRHDSNNGATSTKLRLAVPLQPQSALLLTAVERNDFAKYGLDVSLQDYPSGKRALHDGLFAGKADFAAVSDLPVALAGFERSDFRILARTFSADNVNRVIARKDAGISKPADLRGKRVATQENSAVHYFLYLFLLEHGMSEDDVVMSFMKAQELPHALAAGRIDAFSMREPFIGQAKILLEDNAVLFAAPGIYEQMDLIVVCEKMAKRSPFVLKSVVSALLDAETFTRKHSAQARIVVEKRLGVKHGALNDIWTTSNISVSLPIALLLRIEDQARWSISRHRAHNQVPNYLQLVATEPLRTLKPVFVGFD